jgi:hypothetical protein
MNMGTRVEMDSIGPLYSAQMIEVGAGTEGAEGQLCEGRGGETIGE